MSRREEPTRYSGIYKRIRATSTTYVARWYSKDGRRRSATFDTLAGAKLHRSEMTSARIKGARADLSGGRVLYRDHFEAWYGSKGVRGSTANTELAYYRRHIEPHWGGYRIGDIEPDDIRAWLALMEAKTVGEGPKKRPIARATIARVYRVFGQPLRHAFSEELIARDPTANIVFKVGRRAEAVFLTADELLRLTEALPPFLKMLVPFMADTGLRIGEVLALRVSDVDLARSQVRVSKTLSVSSTGATVINEPKTFRGDRVVPTLTGPVVTGLEAQIRDRRAQPGDLLFPGVTGAMLRPGNLRRRYWDPAVRDAGLDGRKVTPQRPPPHSHLEVDSCRGLGPAPDRSLGGPCVDHHDVRHLRASVRTGREQDAGRPRGDGLKSG